MAIAYHPYHETGKFLLVSCNISGGAILINLFDKSSCQLDDGDFDILDNLACTDQTEKFNHYCAQFTECMEKSPLDFLLYHMPKTCEILKLI